MHAGHVAATYRKGKRRSGSPRAPGAESEKKKTRSPKTKCRGSLGWVPVGTDTACWVLGRKGEVSRDIRSHDTAIAAGSLFACAVAAASLDIGDHMPRRPDSIFIHPDTMHLCGFAIAQPVAVRSVDSLRSRLVICKPWPLKKIELGTVAVSRVVLQSCASVRGERGGGGGGGRGEGEGCEIVQVWRVVSPSLLPPASEVHLSPRSAIDSSVLNESFKNYTRSLCGKCIDNDIYGLYVCEGNLVSVLFCNEDIEFSVERVLPVSQRPEPNMESRLSFNTSLNLTTLLEDSIQLDMSGLCLGEGGGGEGGGERRDRSHHASPCSPTRSHLNVVTSTPGMDVDEVPAHSGMESGQLDGLHSEPNLAAHGRVGTDYTVSLEHQMQELGLTDSENVRGGGGEGDRVADRGEGLVEVTVCKVTAKTKIVFLERHQNDGSKGRVVAMSDIGGLSMQKQLLRELVVYPLQNPSLKGIQFPHGVLLYGPSGVGKSLLSQAVSSETSAYCVSLSPCDFTSSDCSTRLQVLFKEAREKCPSLIVLEDLHSLCASPDGGAERAASSILAACLDALHTAPPSRHVVVMAMTNRIEAIDLALRRPGRFDREIEVTSPNALERKEVLEVLLRGVAHCLGAGEVTGMADRAHGYTGSDLRAVCMQAQHRALRRQLAEGGGDGEGALVRGEDVKVAFREVRPSAMREVMVEVPKVLWSDIGGQAEVKRRLREAVEWPLQHPEAFSRLGITPPKGVLLFGPPGCSKTMIARALATESGLNFIAIKGPELFSKWVGDSERAVRQVFQRARAVAPAIIFFDEIDALAVQRKSEGSSVADRVLAQLLTEMDGVEMLKDVLIVAATNRPDMIDKALLRPGRIDRMIYVPLPSDETRREIFEINFRSTPVGSDVSPDQLVSLTHNFSGAEVVALCQEAALCAMHEDISIEEVSFHHFQQALQTITPQTQPSTIASYEHYSRTLQ